MRDIKFLTPDLQYATPPLSYSAKVGDLLFVSGLPGLEPNGSLKAGDFTAQFQASVAMLRAVLLLAGTEMRRIVKVNVLLTRAGDVAEMNRLYAGAFGPAPFPARTTAVVNALPHPDMLIEIECVADVAP